MKLDVDRSKLSRHRIFAIVVVLGTWMTLEAWVFAYLFWTLPETMFAKAFLAFVLVVMAASALWVGDMALARSDFHIAMDGLREYHKELDKYKMPKEDKLQLNKGVGAFFGTWPGDETDEELQQACKEIR